MEETIKYVENFLREEGTTFQDKLDYVEAKGKIKGKRLGLMETARNMLKKGYSLQDIREITGLSKKEIESIKGE